MTDFDESDFHDPKPIRTSYIGNVAGFAVLTALVGFLLIGICL